MSTVTSHYRQAQLEKARREQQVRAYAEAQAHGVLRPLAWAEQYRRIDDQPFTLTRHQPLAQIYDDDHPFVVIMKPAQVGISELAVTRVLHALDIGASYWQTGKSGLNVAYLFPTASSLSDFSKERFSNVAGESPHLAAMFAGGYDEVTFKQARSSYLYLRGAWAGKQGGGKNPALKSFPADVLVLDEYDEMVPASIAMAEKRLRASTVKRKLYISTPTLPGQGIHGQYLLSDQHVWETKCATCHAWHVLDFFRDVVASDPPGAPRPWVRAPYDIWQHGDRLRLRAAHWTVVCPACRNPIDRCGPGRWVALHPEVKDIRGYHVPALAFPMVDLAELAIGATSDGPTRREEFFRSDLGVPYQHKGSSISLEMIDRLSANLAGGRVPDGAWRQTTMGVDVGSRFHYRVSAIGADGNRVVRAMGAVQDWGGLDDLMSQYRVRLCIIDAMPELHGAQTWASQYPGRVLRATYPAPSALSGQLMRLDEENGRIQINRTMAMDGVLAAVAGGTEDWPAAVVTDPEVRAHLTAPTRVLVPHDDGQPTPAWVHTAPDHLFHACVYDQVAAKVVKPAIAAPVVGRGAKVKLPSI